MLPETENTEIANDEKSVARGPKLNPAAANALWYLIAAGRWPEECITIIKKEFKVEITVNAYYYHVNKHQAEIQERKREIRHKIESLVPIANMMHRARIRQKLVDDLIKQPQDQLTARAINIILDSQAAEMQTFRPEGELIGKLEKLLYKGGDQIVKYLQSGTLTDENIP